MHANQRVASVFQVSGFVGTAYAHATTILNCVIGWRKAGLCPVDRYVFDAELRRLGFSIHSVFSPNESEAGCVIDDGDHSTSEFEAGPQSPFGEVPPKGDADGDLHRVDTELGETNNSSYQRIEDEIVINVKSDGRCFFRSLAISLNDCFKTVAQSSHWTGRQYDGTGKDGVRG